MEEHRQWCDSKNFGITHFGIHYELFDIKSIRNDILHLKLSTTRKIIGFIRFLLLSHDHDTQQAFIKILREEWDTFYVDCYELNKNLNVLHGVHV